MALKNTKLVLRNHAALGTVLTSHPGTMPEDPLYPLTNLVIPDRAVKYHNPGGPGFVLIDVGTSRTTNVVGFLGIRRPPGGTGPSPFYVRSYNTYPNPVVTNGSVTLGSPTLTRSSGTFPTTVKVGQTVKFTNPNVTLLVTNGTNVVTRTGYDFAANGVIIGKQVVLSNGASVPANTTVTNVSVGSITLSNVVTGSTSTAVGTFGSTVAAGATVLSIAGDRSSVTMSANAAVGSETGTVTVTFSDYKDVANSSTTLAENDFAIELATPSTARYWEFEFPAVFQPFALGSFLAGQVYDTGALYSPGSSDSTVRQVVENVAVDGTTTMTRTGPTRKRFKVQFQNVTQAFRDAVLDATFPIDTRPTSVVLLHPHGLATGWCECRVVGNEVEVTHVWSPPDLYSIALNLETMP